MKIYKRRLVVRNLLYFLFLSLVYLQLIFSIYRRESFLSGEFFYNSNNFLLILMVFWAITFLSIYWIKRISKWFLSITLLMIAFYSLYLFYLANQKSILFLSFSYVVLGFYFFSLWIEEMNRAIYSMGFHQNSLRNIKENHFLKADLRSGEKVIEGRITNWDEIGGYFLFDKEEKTKITGLVELEVKFESKKFSEKGRIITGDSKGCGVVFDFKDSRFIGLGWEMFCNIINNRGYDRIVH